MDKENIDKLLEALSRAFSDIALIDLGRSELHIKSDAHGPVPFIHQKEKLIFPEDLEDWIDQLAGEESRDELKQLSQQLIQDAGNGLLRLRRSTVFRLSLPNREDIRLLVIAWAEDAEHLLLCCTELPRLCSALQQDAGQWEGLKKHAAELCSVADVCFVEWNVKTGRFASCGDYEKYELSRYLRDGDMAPAAETLACVHPSDHRTYRKLIAAYQSGTEQIRETVRLRLRDGKYQWTQLQLCARFDQQGNRESCVGVLTNLTEHMQQLKLRRELNDYLNDYLRVMGSGMFIFRMLDRKPDIVFISPDICRFFGMESHVYADALRKGNRPEKYITNALLRPEDYAVLCREGELTTTWTDPDSGACSRLQLRCKRGDGPHSCYYAELRLLPDEPLPEAGGRQSVERSLWCAFCGDAELAVTFDALSGQNQQAEGSVIPAVCRENRSLRAYYETFIRRLHPDDREEVLLHGYFSVLPETEDGKQEFDCRLLSLSEEGGGYVWYRFLILAAPDPEEKRLLLHLRARNVDRQKRMEHRLTQLCRLDPETGLLNKRSFEEICCRFREMEMRGPNLLLLIGIDHYENLKATLGEAEARRVVRELSEILQNGVDSDCVASRFREDTFLVSKHNIENVAAFRKTVYSLQEAMTVRLSNGYLVSVSIGVAACYHDREKGYLCAYETVQKALELARARGGSEVVFSDHALSLAEQLSVPVKKDIYIRTFGYFEVFYNGRPLRFRHEKSKELLALLVDRRGGFVSSREAITALWEDEEVNRVTLARYRKVAMRLHRMLEEYGISEIVEVVDHKRRLVPELVRCDLYDYLTYRPEFSQLFKGSYLLNYSWGETTAADLTSKLWRV